MKKLLGLLLLFIFGFSLAGCSYYYDLSKREMELKAIKVFDSDNNEIEGTYVNFFHGLPNAATKKMNSAAPVFNYYVVKVEEGKEYTIKFYLESKYNKKLTKLVFNNEDSIYSENYYEVTDIVKENKTYIATMVISSLNTSNNLYHIVSWSDDSDVKNYFGSKGSNTYIKGAYLELPKEEENTGWIY